MSDVLILCTNWRDDFWYSDKVAPYPKKSINSIQHLKDKLPIAGIGVYIKGKEKDKDLSNLPPSFIIIKGIKEYDKGVPEFDFSFISIIQGIKSSELLDKIGENKLFFVVKQEKVISIFKEYGVNPPLEWKKLLEENLTSTPSWQSFIGEYFLKILGEISNDNYEDIIAQIFNALGFHVVQLGHRKNGKFPDGIVIYIADDIKYSFAIVYDCKNSNKYYLPTDDKRAMKEYIQDVEKKLKEQEHIQKVYFAFIAHSYNEIDISEIQKETSSTGFLLTSEDMLYLLYKKIVLGRSFLLTNFDKLSSKYVISRETIDKNYPIE